MSPRYPVRFWFLLTVGVLLASPLPLLAKASTWKDHQGASFKGEPTEILGPFAIFRTPGGGGRRVLLRTFSPEDCQRIEREIAQLPERAGSLVEARGIATGELPGRVQRVESGHLVEADLRRQAEPELLLVLSGSHNSGDGWFMAGNLAQFYWRVQRVYPGLMEGVFLGARHDATQHENMAVQSGMPWLVANLRRQPSLASINRYVPGTEGTNVVLVTRHGVPLAAGHASDATEVQAFVDEASELLWQIDPANPAGWLDRRHYAYAVRPAKFATARAAAVLIGDPLRPDVLRRYGVKRVAARLAVTADGKVTPTMTLGIADMPPELVTPMATALAQAVVAPAVEQGRPVAGELDYLLEVPPADAAREAERVWLGSKSFPTLPLVDWLVLRPIKVPEQEFESKVIGEKADGTVILNSFEVNSGKISRAAQMNAFNTDWFAEAGAGSVRPQAGQAQKIDAETTLTWEKVRAQNGFVNMQTTLPRDYVVGYAWTEFDSPRETDAWLGLGSDDGVKIWLNGVLVHDKWIRRPSRVDDDVVPLRLKKGANQILIKIQNATIDWSFIYRLRLRP